MASRWTGQGNVYVVGATKGTLLGETSAGLAGVTNGGRQGQTSGGQDNAFVKKNPGGLGYGVTLGGSSGLAIRHWISSDFGLYLLFGGRVEGQLISHSPEYINVADALIICLFEPYPGDANCDGRINSLDITTVERVIAGLDEKTLGCDANRDGNINALDITKVERFIAGLN